MLMLPDFWSNHLCKIIRPMPFFSLFFSICHLLFGAQIYNIHLCWAVYWNRPIYIASIFCKPQNIATNRRYLLLSEVCASTSTLEAYEIFATVISLSEWMLADFVIAFTETHNVYKCADTFRWDEHSIDAIGIFLCHNKSSWLAAAKIWFNQISWWP